MQAKHVCFIVQIGHDLLGQFEEKWSLQCDDTWLMVNVYLDGKKVDTYPVVRSDDGVWETAFYHQYWRELEMALAGNHRMLDKIAVFLRQAREFSLGLFEYEGMGLMPLQIQSDEAQKRFEDLARLPVSSCEGTDRKKHVNH